MKLLLDENLSPAHAERLCLAGHDVVSALKAGLSGASDAKIRTAAIEGQRILVTLDADFGNLRRFPPTSTPGVIWLKPRRPTEPAIVSLLERAMPLLSTIDLTGKLAVIDEEKIRLRQA
jgi:predicted nuclease of predicted toxin-antitoxin system